MDFEPYNHLCKTSANEPLKFHNDVIIQLRISRLRDCNGTTMVPLIA